MLNDLGLTDKNAATSGCACGCGGHDAKAKQTDATASVAEESMTTTTASTATTQATQTSEAATTELQVTGMTCGHCVSSVTEELSAIDGVESVQVQLNAGGVSTVTVASTATLDPAAVKAAIDEAGYSLADA